MRTNGYPELWPIISLETKLQKRLLELLREILMTPAARARITRVDNPAAESDAFVAFLRGENPA